MSASFTPRHLLIESDGSEKIDDDLAEMRDLLMKMLAYIVAVVISVSAFATLFGPASLSLAEDSFKPIQRLTTWYTDRNLVDIEIVGSTSLLPDTHRLEPDRILRFRLERAYVSQLSTQRKPGFETVAFGFDAESGLPESLLVAVSQGPKFREQIPEVPRLAPSERARRFISLSLSSDVSDQVVRRTGEEVLKCIGAAAEIAFKTYEGTQRTDCIRPTYPRGSRHVGQYEPGLTIVIRCQEASEPGIGCSLRFPFERFGVRMDFHHDELANWRAVIDRARAFLRSKQYSQ